jgi:adenylosuccinate synthase
VKLDPVRGNSRLAVLGVEEPDAAYRGLPLELREGRRPRVRLSRHAMRAVLLSGRLCSGKTTLALSLPEREDFEVLSARALLQSRSLERLDSREALQTFGELVERETGGRWLADAVARLRSLGGYRLVIDSARTRLQLKSISDALPDEVAHVHLTADADELRRRLALSQEPSAGFGVSGSRSLS